MTTTRTLNRIDIDTMLSAGVDSVASLLGVTPQLSPATKADFAPETTMAVVVDGETIVFGISIDPTSAGLLAAALLSEPDAEPDEATLAGVGTTLASQFFSGVEALVGEEFTEVEPEPFESYWQLAIDDAVIQIGTASIAIEPAPSAPPAVSRLSGVRLDVSVELGRARIPVKELLALDEGGVIRLGRAVGEPVDLVVNGTVTARGEIVVVDGRLGLRITSLV